VFVYFDKISPILLHSCFFFFYGASAHLQAMDSSNMYLHPSLFLAATFQFSTWNKLRHPSFLCVCVISDSLIPVSIVFLSFMSMIPHPYWYAFYLYFLHFCGYVSCLFLPCLKHCATSRKFAGYIPDGVSWIFHWHNSHGCSMALGSTQPITEMSTRNIPWW
jgi:hypothetical protein